GYGGRGRWLDLCLARRLLSLLTRLRRAVVAPFVTPRVLAVVACAHRSALRTVARRRLRQVASALISALPSRAAIVTGRLGLTPGFAPFARFSNVALRGFPPFGFRGRLRAPVTRYLGSGRFRF